MLTGLPPAEAPVTWSCGFWPEALAPASLISAYLAPENDSASNVANGPPHVVSTPILIAPAGAEAANGPPQVGSPPSWTAPGGGGAGAAAVEEPLEDELLFELPHATSAI